MIKYSKRIDDELTKLGFENVKEIFSTAQLLFDITYMYAEVPVKGVTDLGYDRIHFCIVLMPRTKKWPHNVHYIKASTGRSKRDYSDDEDRIVVSTSAENPPILTREELTKKVEAVAKTQREHYGRTYTMLLMEKIQKMKNKPLPAKRPRKP